MVRVAVIMAEVMDRNRRTGQGSFCKRKIRPDRRALAAGISLF